MNAYYNEIDPHAAQWLRNLIAEGLIAPGDVDERSIREVQPDDIKHYRQVHFFAGIGGWSLALRLAGWPDDRPVWTGSCPCQPFSSAGKRKGNDDDRHLWPEMFRLIRGCIDRECRPPKLFMEQVASKAGLAWLDGVFADLEGAGYACGAADLCAAGLNAPHIRQRLFGVADADGAGVRGGGHRTPEAASGGVQGADGQRQRVRPDAGAIRGDQSGRMEFPHDTGPFAGREACEAVGYGRAAEPAGGGLELPHGVGPRGARLPVGRAGEAAGAGEAGGLGDTQQPGPQGLAGHGDDGHEPGWLDADAAGSVAAAGDAPGGLEHAEGDGRDQGRAGADGRLAPGGRWSDFILIPCADGKLRRASAQPGDEPLAHGLPRSVGPGSTKLERVGLMAAKANRRIRLSGYGNAIVPELAAVFIQATEEVATY